MSIIDDHFRRIEQIELPELRQRLDLLESGAMSLGERRVSGSWIDVTQREIDHLKKTIGTFEKIVAHYRNNN
jgi:hypothetical protein